MTLTDQLIPWASAVLRTTPQRWLELTQTLPAQLLHLPPVPGEWSALDCLQHLVDTENSVFPERVQYFLNGQDFPAFDPDSQGTVVSPDGDPQAIAQTFFSLRDASLEQLAKVQLADLQRQSYHAELGKVTLAEMLHEWAAHDLMHIVQAERALLQPFIAGSGPWQPYFADHVAGRST